MKSCEEYQVNISAMLDGELRGEELSDTIKHLAQCQDCMAVLKSFGSLQDRVGADSVPPPVPGNAWREISEKTSPKQKAVSLPFRPRVFKVIGIAAAFVFCFGMGYFMRNSVVPAVNYNVPIVLASDRGQMSEAQFLSLTRDLLTADPEYHRRMYQILHALSAEYMRGGFETFDEGDLSTSVQMVTADDENGKDVDVYRF